MAELGICAKNLPWGTQCIDSQESLGLTKLNSCPHLGMLTLSGVLGPSNRYDTFEDNEKDAWGPHSGVVKG